MPINGIITEEVYLCAKYKLSKSTDMLKRYGAVAFLIQVFDLLCICLSYEHSEDKSRVESISSHLPKYGQEYCDANEMYLKQFVLWRNSYTHMSFDIRYDMVLTQILYFMIRKYKGLFERYGINVDYDAIVLELADYCKYLESISKDAHVLTKSRVKKINQELIESVTVDGKCPCCCGTTLIPLSEGLTCFDCKHIIKSN